MIEKIEIVDRFKLAQESLVIQQSDFSLSVINQMVVENAINIAPGYQRRERWNSEKQSALIESFLLNVPVPPIYLSEDEYGTYSVIDGKQRITAVCKFLSGELKLKDLKNFSELNGMSFGDLPSQLQNALNVRPYLRVTTLLKQSDPNLKYEVFLRLNTGGELLKPQEIRNVAYSGPFNDLLLILSKHVFLRKQLKITSEKSQAYRNMDDVEHVLRFFTIKSNWQKMGSVLSQEMDRFMLINRNATTEKFHNDFTRAIGSCISIWGDYAFQKPINNGWREQLISPLYDAEMVAVSLLSDQEIGVLQNKRNEVIDRTRILFETDHDFIKSITQATNNSSSVERRVRTIFEMLKTIAGE